MYNPSSTLRGTRIPFQRPCDLEPTPTPKLLPATVEVLFRLHTAAPTFEVLFGYVVLIFLLIFPGHRSVSAQESKHCIRTLNSKLGFRVKSELH